MGFLGKLKEKVTPPNVHVTVALKKQFFSLGENFEGTVRILPGEEVGCDEIRCEIACVERAQGEKGLRPIPEEGGQEVWGSAVLFSSKPQLSGPMHLSEGVALSFPLSVPLPPHLPPSMRTLDRRAEWSLKGVVAVRGRPDAASKTLELVVAPRELAQQPQPATVTCKRCGAVYPRAWTAAPTAAPPAQLSLLPAAEHAGTFRLLPRRAAAFSADPSTDQKIASSVEGR